MSVCGGCDPCEKNCGNSCCNNACLRWGFDGCYLRGRCADGTELDPLNLCEWLKVHETCTELKLVPQTTDDELNSGYMLYINECGEEYKFWVCDFLSLGSIQCLKDVHFPEGHANPCDIMVFDPDCDGDESNPTHGKWTNYHIPDADDCVITPDENGYSKVLVKDACGCIRECKLFVQPNTWEYALRDSWPDDPDEPFKHGTWTGNNSEIIDVHLDTKIPMFGKTDLEVTIQYGFGVQNNSPDGESGRRNIKSTVVPMSTASHNPSMADTYNNAIVVQGTNNLPWGSHEWQVSRTFIVPKGQKLYLNHAVEVRRINTSLVPYNDDSGASWRLHSLHVVVRATKGVKV